MAGFSTAIWRLRAPLLVSILSFLVLSWPDQIKEVYASLLEASYSRLKLADSEATQLKYLGRDYLNLENLEVSRLEILLAFASLAALTLALLFAARALTAADPRGRQELAANTAGGFWLRYLPWVICLGPLLGVIWGLRGAWSQITSENFTRTLAALGTLPKPETKAKLSFLLSQADGWLHEAARGEARLAFYAIGICAAFGTLLLLIMLGRGGAAQRLPARRMTIFSWPAASSLFFTAVFIGLALFFAGQSLNAGNPSTGDGLLSRLQQVDFTAVPRGLGAIFILNLFLICLVLLLSALFSIYDKYKTPVASLLLIWVIFISWWSLNDNHQVRLIPREQKDGAQQGPQGGGLPPAAGAGGQERDIVKAFQEWLASRPAERKKAFADSKEPYPIYIVAAQGGGLYSANLAALTLARLYDHCPALQDHLFAISGVSGGSLGGGLFAALLSDEKAKEQQLSASNPKDCALIPEKGGAGTFESEAAKFLGSEFLSPLGASGLFPDMLQRFLPVRVGPFDRIRAFEASLEQTWSRKLKRSGNPFRAPFRSLWRPDGGAPMLLFNATIVETGSQMLILPAPWNAVRSLHETILDRNEDLPLSAAAGVSARFPYIMPAASFYKQKPEGKPSLHRLADGGYFDNSGVEIALSLLKELDPRPQAGLQKSENREFEFKLIILSEDDEPGEEWQGLGELLSPLRAFNRARFLRAPGAVNRAHASGYDVHLIKINHDQFRLPLGWQLSRLTQIKLALQIGDPARCLSAASLTDFLAELREEEQKPDAQSAAKGEQLERLEKLLTLLNSNHCRMCKILRELKHGTYASYPCGDGEEMALSRSQQRN